VTPRPCLGCGEPVKATRCTGCAPAAERTSHAAKSSARARGYTSSWDKLSARARRAQPFCTDCGTTADLQSDHLRWPARSLRDVAVRCGPCNRAAGPARTRGGTPPERAADPRGQAQGRLHTVAPYGGDAA